jgi:hypothetical protein
MADKSEDDVQSGLKLAGGICFTLVFCAIFIFFIFHNGGPSKFQTTPVVVTFYTIAIGVCTVCLCASYGLLGYGGYKLKTDQDKNDVTIGDFLLLVGGCICCLIAFSYIINSVLYIYGYNPTFIEQWEQRDKYILSGEYDKMAPEIRRNVYVFGKTV